MLVFLMDEKDVVNLDGITLSEFLGESDEIDLRRIL
jgi:hypothetical protein